MAAKSLPNPLLPYGPDPWAVFHEGFYYYMHSTRTDLTIWKARSLSHLATAERRTVWTAPETGPFSRHVWSPELHFLQHRWLIYFTADDERGIHERHRMWAIECSSSDPLHGRWSEPVQIVTPDDKWSLDGTPFLYRNQLYFAWSGWEGDDNRQQNIYLCRMRDPLTCEGPRVLVSAPTHPWERIERNPDSPNPLDHILVNEGPAPLQHHGQLFMTYSANGCWTDQYCLGLLCAQPGSDLTNPASWSKMDKPVFQMSEEKGVYGPGHNCFLNKPDGSDWLLYHANPEPGQGCENERSPRLQPVRWRNDGTPNFGVPERTNGKP